MSRITTLTQVKEKDKEKEDETRKKTYKLIKNILEENEKLREESIGYQYVYEETSKINDELVNEIERIKQEKERIKQERDEILSELI